MAAWATPMHWATIRQRSVSKFLIRLRKPSPGFPMRISSVRTTPSKYISQKAATFWPILCRGAVLRPGASLGTIHMDMDLFSRAGSSSLAMTSTLGKTSPWVTHVFWPLRR